MKRIFEPSQILFAPTYQCNLKCRHCNQKQSKTRLSIATALRFMEECKNIGLNEVGFTGGEPLLYPEFIAEVSKKATLLGFRFDRITTNAGWFKTNAFLDETLGRIVSAGYDGKFCISVDDYHQVPTEKIARFIQAAVEIMGRTEVISIAHVGGINQINKVAKILRGKINKVNRLEVRPAKNFVGLSAKITEINLCPIGKAKELTNPWAKHWFKEDFCRGPGQVFYVLPNGEVKPCCGFANDLPSMTIGSIYKNNPQEILKKAQTDPFLKIVFTKGLLKLKDILKNNLKLELPPTLDHCFFCWYAQNKGIRKYLK